MSTPDEPPNAGHEPMLERTGRRLAHLSSIRGLWATVAGIALVVIAFATDQSGAWFVPLLVVGLVLIAAGLLGPRVRGRVSLEFGLGGATVDLQLHVAPPGQVGRLPRRTPVAVPASAAPAPAVIEGPALSIDPAPVFEHHHDPAMMAVRAAQAADAVAAAVARADANGAAPAQAPAPPRT
jgi:hypothetical protein